MSEKYIYVVDCWVPFPSSEYGGLSIIIASSDAEAIEILSEGPGYSYEKREYPEYVSWITENVQKASKFKLADGYENGVVTEFIT